MTLACRIYFNPENDNGRQGIKALVLDVPQRTVQRTVTKAEFDHIRSISACGRKVESIKFIRDQYGLGLYDAKMLVDTICAVPTHHV